MKEQRIHVTKSFLPPLDEYVGYLKKIWDSGQLTNGGELTRQFEKEVKNYLGVEHFQFVTNGTLALQIALKALEIEEGEIITTPFSYVATTSAILWERCDPVFVDILPDTFCIDPAKIEAAITPKTKAIMAVHVFGNPCEVEEIEQIAKKHKLKVIYDGAHAFGVTYKGKSLLDYGDISICSFHATKLFHTIEGGCLVAKDKDVHDRIELIKRFGHNQDDHYMLGINAKASEFQAAMGLSNLKYIASIISNREKLSKRYDSKLHVNRAKSHTSDYNYAYYPVVFSSEKKLLEATKRLNDLNIFPRRYFYPSLNKLPYIGNAEKCPISEDLSLRILCLPLYNDLDGEAINKICSILEPYEVA